MELLEDSTDTRDSTETTSPVKTEGMDATKAIIYSIYGNICCVIGKPELALLRSQSQYLITYIALTLQIPP